MQIIPATKDTADVLIWVFRLFPSFCMGDALLQLALIQTISTFEQVFLPNATQVGE